MKVLGTLLLLVGIAIFAMPFIKGEAWAFNTRLITFAVGGVTLGLGAYLRQERDTRKGDFKKAKWNNDSNPNLANYITIGIVVVVIGVAAFFFMKPDSTSKPIAAPPAKSQLAPRPASAAAAVAPAPASADIFAGTKPALDEALRLYPDLNRKGSPLQARFAERVKYLKANNSAYFNDKTWPLKLAKEIAK